MLAHDRRFVAAMLARRKSPTGAINVLIKIIINVRPQHVSDRGLREILFV